MIPILGTLQYNRPDLLLRLVNSIDYPVECLLVIVTGKLEPWEGASLALETGKNTNIKSLKVLEPGANIGCAGGWNNIMAETFYDPAKSCCLICGNDIQFGPGDIAKMHQASLHPGVGFVYSHLSYNAFLVTRLGYERVLWFDENIWPAYCEDLDHHYRVKLSGVGEVTIADTGMVHGEAPSWGSSTIYSDPALRAENHITHGKNWEYMEKKWRWDRNSGTAQYAKPFNESKRPIFFWRLGPSRKRQPHFKESSP